MRQPFPNLGMLENRGVIADAISHGRKGQNKGHRVLHGKRLSHFVSLARKSLTLLSKVWDRPDSGLSHPLFPNIFNTLRASGTTWDDDSSARAAKMAAPRNALTDRPEH